METNLQIIIILIITCKFSKTNHLYTSSKTVYSNFKKKLKKSCKKHIYQLCSFNTRNKEDDSFPHLKTKISFIDTYQSPSTQTQGLDRHPCILPFSSIFISSPLFKNRDGTFQNKLSRYGHSMDHFVGTSEAQVFIGRSAVVQTSARFCRCLKLCSMLTCTISASICFAFPN